jgi:hypothetical protein
MQHAASRRHSFASVDIAMFLGVEGDKPIHHQDDPSSCRCRYLIARD